MTWGKGVQPAAHAIAPGPTPVDGVHWGSRSTLVALAHQRVPQHLAVGRGRSPRPELRAGIVLKSTRSTDRRREPEPSFAFSDAG